MTAPAAPALTLDDLGPDIELRLAEAIEGALLDDVGCTLIAPHHLRTIAQRSAAVALDTLTFRFERGGDVRGADLNSLWLPILKELQSWHLLRLLDKDALSGISYVCLAGVQRIVDLQVAAQANAPAVAAPVRDTQGLCMSRGPRIGGDGVPYCKKRAGHDVDGGDRTHAPAVEDGWGAVTWTDPY